MKIKEVRSFSHDLGTSRPYTIAYKTVTEVINAFVEIELENGITGIGAANPSSMVVGESVDDTIRTLDELDFEFLKGKTIEEFDACVRDVQDRFQDKPGTSVAIDIALYDAFTQHLGVSLGAFFGQKHKSLPTSVTIGIKNVAETIEETEEYYGMGFRVIKVKTGLNPEEDAERVIRMNEKHTDLTIRVDANQGYSVDDLNTFVALSDPVSLELIEQPFSVESFVERTNQLDRSVLDLVVADESLKNPQDAVDLIRNCPGLKIFNIKLMKTGGLRSAQEIAQIAQYAGVDLMWGCNDESVVSISAALHLALSCKHTRYIDLDGSLDVLHDVVEGGFKLDKGQMSVTGCPGLGVTRIA